MREALKQKAFLLSDRLGFHVLPKNYHSPISDYSWLEANREVWTGRATLTGISWNLDEQVRWLEEVCTVHYQEVAGLGVYRAIAESGWGPGFGPIESQVLHCFIRQKNPPHVLEVGSGVSTACIVRAARLNEQEGRGQPAITSIEPHPFPALQSLQEVSHVRQLCQTAPLTMFESLRAGDLLFLDSSHAVKVGSEVNRLYLDVIPRLSPGVFIHIHNIYLPYLYSPEVLDSYYAWQETSLLLALLTENKRLRVSCCLSALHHDRTEELRLLLEDYRPRPSIDGISGSERPNLHFPSSIWLQTQ